MLLGGSTRPWERFGTPAVGGVVALLAVLPLALGDLYFAHLVAQGSLLLLYVLSWDLFCWPTRQVNFGHTFFIAAAAYTSGLLDTRLGLDPWLAMALATVVAAFAAVLLGLMTLRLRGPYFAMVTMAFQLMLFRFLFLFSDLFGGGEGVIGIRPLVGRPLAAATVTSLFCLGGFVLCVLFRCSTPCLLLRASGADDSLARATGVHVWRYRTAAFGLSGALAGLGGALHAHTFRQVTSELGGDWSAALVVLLGVIGAPLGIAGVASITLAYFAVKQLLLPLGGYDAPVLAGLLLGWMIWRTRVRSSRQAGSAMAKGTAL
ncbi:MAG: branched-chain amino acid ABC transporter permease [bacterium]|nr:branched-chain amino acid ABC transporter permease [bacterium]